MRKRLRKKLARLCSFARKKDPWPVARTAFVICDYYEYEKEIIESRGMDVHSAYLKAKKMDIIRKSAQLGHTKQHLDIFTNKILGKPFFEAEDYLP